MKFKEFLALMADDRGFIPTPRFRRVITKNERATAREEAIAAKIIEAANPRENITGRHPWGPEESIQLQQLWIHPQKQDIEWREVPIVNEDKYFTVEDTEHGPLPIPNAIKEPGVVHANFQDKIRQALGNSDL